METFQQIRELDDEESDEFSREMVYAFFTQAEDTFKSMDGALYNKDLAELSSLGHFLKGSSAALGVRKVQNSCEKIQHYGKLRDEEAGTNLKPEEALKSIGSLLVQVKKEYLAAERLLKKLYTPHTP
ncbi:histidine kinase, phosphotransfer Hpt [Macrolepiota fuliginosa MF-IS2]|uniref:Histidine kinase, phosphotransfer Hpt n=1 Tax=Macrolepiota fuliginosa MF-IS2 TaxID=1400762 RepID=A0A9P5XSW7_9AGAR|nr:histidine kinase, phosphotransfer Hpt [Macrolepiota fuliginosa MF-IS2]